MLTHKASRKTLHCAANSKYMHLLPEFCDCARIHNQLTHFNLFVASVRDFRFWAQFIRKSVNHRVMQFHFNPSETLPRIAKMKKCLSLSRSQKRSYASALGYANTREG